MDVFNFNTFINLCSNSNVILSYKNTFEDCNLLIPYKSYHDKSTVTKEINLITSIDNSIINNYDTNHICNTVFIVEDNPNILNNYAKMIQDKNIN